MQGTVPRTAFMRRRIRLRTVPAGHWGNCSGAIASEERPGRFRSFLLGNFLRILPLSLLKLAQFNHLRCRIMWASYHFLAKAILTTEISRILNDCRTKISQFRNGSRRTICVGITRAKNDIFRFYLQ